MSLTGDGPAGRMPCNEPQALAARGRELPLPWKQWLVFEALDSTQRELARRAQAGQDVRGLVIQALAQTAGRGRMQRRWSSRPGGLYLSVGLPGWMTEAMRPMVGWLPMMAAFACARVLREELGVEARLKWPNDVLASEGKVAGVLGEVLQVAGGDQWVALLGMGLNWDNPVQPEELTGLWPAATVAGPTRPELAGEQARERFAARWLAELARWFAEALAEPQAAFERLAAQAEPLMWGRGGWLSLAGTEHGAIRGRLLGLGTGGAARLELEDGSVTQVFNGSVVQWTSEPQGQGRDELTPLNKSTR